MNFTYQTLRPKGLGGASWALFWVALVFAMTPAVFAQGISNTPANPSALADLKPDPLLVDHSNFFEPEYIYSSFDEDGYIIDFKPEGLTYQVYSAVGFGLANSIMLVGPEGRVVIVDTLEDAGTAAEVAKEFRAKLESQGVPNLPAAGKLPIDAIIYTHNHIDHTGGVQGFLEWADRPPCPAEDANAVPWRASDHGGDAPFSTDGLDCVAILAQENVVSAVINTGTVVGSILVSRSAYMYGNFLPPDDIVNDGIGPNILPKGPSGFWQPSRTFSHNMQVTAAGLRMFLVYVPSETNDELVVFLADHLNGTASPGRGSGDWGTGPGLLLTAEVLQGPAFPNLYSLRGTQSRNPAVWFRSVDRLRQFDSWCLVPSHEPPLCGRDNIETLLVNYRDAIQFTHDQTMRFMNQGFTPPEMVGMIELPQYLLDNLQAIQPPTVPDAAKPKDPRDFLRPFYGSVPQSVREIYVNYLGWYEADPVALDPTPPVQLAANLVRMMGGGERVRKEARQALAWGEYQWAAELATLLVRVDAEDEEARGIKADAFVRPGQRQHESQLVPLVCHLGPRIARPATHHPGADRRVDFSGNRRGLTAGGLGQFLDYAPGSGKERRQGNGPGVLVPCRWGVGRSLGGSWRGVYLASSAGHCRAGGNRAEESQGAEGGCCHRHDRRGPRAVAPGIGGECPKSPGRCVPQSSESCLGLRAP